LDTEPGKVRERIASHSSYRSSSSSKRVPITPRWVPKNVLWVEPVTKSAPSSNGRWKWGPTSPSTCAMSYISTAGIACSSRNRRIGSTGSRWMITLLPSTISSGRYVSISSSVAGTSTR
jgi:hypothetical protein